tara:strand:- start:48 stop:263 length:216 start_codon:yes stop_codon:yes gene_type:complete
LQAAAVAAEIAMEDLAADPADLTLVQVRGVLVLPLELLLYKALDLVVVEEETELTVLMAVPVLSSSHIQPK